MESELPLPEQCAATLRDRMADGRLAAVALVEACIARIDEREETVRAWEWFDADAALAQARALDALLAGGGAPGPLHGLPVALKDVIDTAGIPTANGTVLDAGRVPERDSAVVARLKAAGAIVMGKAVTTELAFLKPSKTRNPLDPTHTPGGSSAGSAAAVAAGMVPLAIGTQTGGSVVRPASFCGIVGFKPTFGTIARDGVLLQSPSLDTIGVFARTLDGAALLAGALFDAEPEPGLLELARAEPAPAPVFAFTRTPFWERAEGETRAAVEALAARLGAACFDAELPDGFAEAPKIRERINDAEMAKCYGGYMRRGSEALSEAVRTAIETGERVSDGELAQALEQRERLNAGLGPIFARCDAMLMPAAPGAAPAGFATTGDSIFNGPWTLCGTPAVTLPLFRAANGLPVGVQLVGPRGGDASLLRTARWLDGFAAEIS